ncbi:hypothetical protein TVAG_132880 [Trichomonas vaginalis G3]|uniref:Uncharacterized protein n=1 Tax=Trichomonas vaginalis (strain ATCC PRA-98 / G3) TaxID=412133 RepID=A2G3I0_TRIV3|nr:hypothetical protein TVAGG3_0972670 [Trichomonas vaginalis G3]EAX88283.1 hypothetical protein TVAG_132880 [Trichomonas vaginalis G3]KAI5488702.1 hypothetical protein TVAGG3_0972670 [Trichomonas vaginalis G3]|eukprot:XP_001301213.1 hypothetical protein [Trichomonas vaginalis G3]
MKKSQLQEMTFGKKSGEHEDMTEVVQGWDNRIKEFEEHSAQVRSKSKVQKKSPKKDTLPSDTDPNFTYGMSTHDIDVRADPFLHSNAVIAQRMTKQEEEEKRAAAKAELTGGKNKKKIDPLRPTAASIGHTKHAPTEPALKDTFKMKRFTNKEHGVIYHEVQKQKEADQKAKEALKEKAQ